MKNNSSKYNICQIVGVSVVCALLVLGTVLGTVLGVVFGFRSSSEGAITNLTPQDEFVVREQVSEGITLLSGVATTAADGSTTKTLTATVNPADSLKTGYSWTVAFVNPNSTWANGKDVTQYVTVAENSSNELQATVTFKKRFNEQIKVTITCDAKPAVMASATVDCYKVLTGVTINLNSSKNSIRLYGLGQQDAQVDGDFLPYDYNVLITPQLSDGTLEPVDTSSKIVLNMNAGGTDEVVSGGILQVARGYDEGYLTPKNLYEIDFYYGSKWHATYAVELVVYPNTMSMSETSIKF